MNVLFELISNTNLLIIISALNISTQQGTLWTLARMSWFNIVMENDKG